MDPRNSHQNLKMIYNFFYSLKQFRCKNIIGHFTTAHCTTLRYVTIFIHKKPPERKPLPLWFSCLLLWVIYTKLNINSFLFLASEWLWKLQKNRYLKEVKNRNFVQINGIQHNKDLLMIKIWKTNILLKDIFLSIKKLSCITWVMINIKY